MNQSLSHQQRVNHYALFLDHLFVTLHTLLTNSTFLYAPFVVLLILLLLTFLRRILILFFLTSNAILNPLESHLDSLLHSTAKQVCYPVLSHPDPPEAVLPDSVLSRLFQLHLDFVGCVHHCVSALGSVCISVLLLLSFSPSSGFHHQSLSH